MEEKWKERRRKRRRKRDWIKTLAGIGFVWMFFGIWVQNCYAREMEKFTYEGPVFGCDEKGQEPDLIIEQGGKKYQRVSLELIDALEEGTLTYVSASIPYELEGNQEPPESAVLTINDERTGEDYDREVPRRESVERDIVWTSDFSFPLTVYGYDADIFFLGDCEIPSNSDLSEYDSVFLETMGLSEDAYRIERIEWSGESYEEDGVLCRDAMAYGEKLVRHIEVMYGGQVRTPDRMGKQYVAVYEEIQEEEKKETEISVKKSEEETKQEEDVISVQDSNGSIKQWLKEHITMVTLSGLFVIVVLFGMILWWLSRKEKRGEAGD